METWQDLYRRAYQEEVEKDREFWRMIRKHRDEITTKIHTPHGTLYVLKHELLN